MRESGAAFFTSLTLHSLAMAFVVGINLAIAFRLVGFAPKLPIAPLTRFYPLHWYCAVLILVSGLALLLAYPAKALTNEVFYLKLTALSIGLLISKRFQYTLSNLPEDEPVQNDHKQLAYLSLVVWATTICAGRFLAYTHNVLLASRFY